VSGTYDQDDLARMPSADLQRALLKLGDDLVVQALCAARPEVRASVLANLSRRRRADVGRRAAGLEFSGELSARSAAAALHNLVRRVFEISSPERDADRASRETGEVRRRRAAGDQPRAEKERSQGPDLTEASFNLLREARAVISAFEGVSGYAGHLRRCRQGISGAVLLKRWLGRKPVVARDRIYETICGQGNVNAKR
jgi:hypothetical protein